MTTELLYRGRLDLGDGTEPRALEVWRSGSAAVVFDGPVQVAQATDVVLGFTDDRRLRITGTGPDDQPVEWVGPDPAVNQGQWSGQRVRWSPTEVWTAATVTWTNYGVSVAAAGQDTRHLAAARTEVTGGQRWIVNGSERYLVENPRRGCGCGR